MVTMKGLVVLMMLLTAVSAADELNIHIPESMIFRQTDTQGVDHFYVRVYQAIQAPIPGTGLDSFPEHPKHKDIFADRNGNIVTVESPATHEFWIGVADYKNQLKFIESYKGYEGSKPMIRSFLVDYDTVRKTLNRNVVFTEDDFKRYKKQIHKEKMPSTVPLNVDKKYQNQFGAPNNVNELSRNALPNSIVTYAEDPQIYKGDAYKHFGTIVELAELEERVPHLETGNRDIHENLIVDTGSLVADRTVPLATDDAFTSQWGSLGETER